MPPQPAKEHRIGMSGQLGSSKWLRCSTPRLASHLFRFKRPASKVGMTWSCAMPTVKRNSFRSNIHASVITSLLDRSLAMMKTAFVCCRAFTLHGERCCYLLPLQGASFSQIVKLVNEHIRGDRRCLNSSLG